MAPSTSVPTILKDPGFLFWAPVGSTYPANTVAGSVFTDDWPVAWINLGATADGSEFSYEISVDQIKAAELLDPVKYQTTARAGNISFALMDWTLANLKRVMNGGSLTVVSGTTTTTLSKYEPPAAGAEVRSLIGWQSLDNTVRLVAHQCIQGGDIAMQFHAVDSTDTTTMSAQFNFELPVSGTYAGIPFSVWTAGVARG